MEENYFNSFLDPIAKVWGNAPVFTLKDSRNTVLKKVKNSDEKAQKRETKRI